MSKKVLLAYNTLSTLLLLNISIIISSIVIIIIIIIIIIFAFVVQGSWTLCELET